MVNRGRAEQVAARVREAADTAGLTLNKLSTLTGIPYPTLRRRMHALPGMFTVDEIVRIAEATGADFGWLAAGIEAEDAA